MFNLRVNTSDERNFAIPGDQQASIVMQFSNKNIRKLFLFQKLDQSSWRP